MGNGGYAELRKRFKVGRPSKYETPEDLQIAADEYFEWQDKQSIDEVKGVGYQGEYELQSIPRYLPYTIQGMATYCNIGIATWQDYRKKPTFAGVIKYIEETIYNQKFQGATAGSFNANIIARDLGLKDKTDITSDDKPLNPEGTTDLELARKIAFGLRAAKESMDKTPVEPIGDEEAGS